MQLSLEDLRELREGLRQLIEALDNFIRVEEDRPRTVEPAPQGLQISAALIGNLRALRTSLLNLAERLEAVHLVN